MANSEYSSKSLEKIIFDHGQLPSTIRTRNNHNKSVWKHTRTAAEELGRRFGKQDNYPYSRVSARETAIHRRLTKYWPQEISNRITVTELAQNQGYIIKIYGDEIRRVHIHPHQLEYKKLRPRLLLLL